MDLGRNNAATAKPRSSDDRRLPVLVIDDNEADRRLAMIQLGQVWPFERDLHVECASDGTEALEKIRVGRFKLIVLDWNLPGASGAEVLRTLFDHGVTTPVVVVSGRQRDELGEDIEALGASYVNKNELDPARFSKAIASALSLRKRRTGPILPPPLPGTA